MASPKPKTAHKVILLVEDDIIIRLGVADYLRGCGFVVLEASGSKEARTIIIAGPKFDILLSDAQLAESPEDVFVRRIPERGRQLDAADVAKAGEIVEAASTNDPKGCRRILVLHPRALPHPQRGLKRPAPSLPSQGGRSYR